MEGSSDIKRAAGIASALKASKFTNGETEAKQFAQGQSGSKLLRPMGKPGQGLLAI